MLNGHTDQVTSGVQIDINVFADLPGFCHGIGSEFNQGGIGIGEILNFHIQN